MHVILIDAKNAMFRFGFVHPRLTAPSGELTGAVYGLTGLLPRLKKKYPESRFVMVWDGEGPTWRHSYWEGYKANRKPSTDPTFESVRKGVLRQIPGVKKTTALLGIPQLEVPGVEADDLIGILAMSCLAQKCVPVIYSSDKDFLQLMHMGVTVIRCGVDPETPQSVFERFGCKPEDVLKVRALAGDSSDGIPPACKGVGEKTAAKYVAAGIDPSSTSLCAAREYAAMTKDEGVYLKASSKLTLRWADVRRNYHLMRIATCFNEPHLRPQGAVIGQCGYAVTTLVREAPKRIPANYRTFLAGLSEWNLREALEERDTLWHIQK